MLLTQDSITGDTLPPAAERRCGLLHAERRAEHSEGLSGAGLTIAQQVDVVSIEPRPHQRLGNGRVDLLLRRIGRNSRAHVAERLASTGDAGLVPAGDLLVRGDPTRDIDGLVPH